MTKADYKKISKQMQDYAKKLRGSEEESRALLERTGIIDKNGNLTKPYQHLCIPQN